MALSTKLGAEVPEGALVLSQEEALNYQKSVIRDWPTVTDIIFLKYGSELAGGTTLVSSLPIFQYFKRALNIRSNIYSVFLAPSLLFPAYTSTILTDRLVTNNTLLMKLKCPVCNQIKFALVQCYCGVVFPAVYGLASFTLVSNFIGSYDFRSAAADPKVFWKEMFKFLKGGTRSYQIAGILQSVLIITLPYMQAKELLKITEKLNAASDDELSESQSVLQ